MCWAAVAQLALGLLMRCLERPGAVRQDDLDAMEAAKEAKQFMGRQPVLQGTFRLPDGRQVDRATLQQLVARERMAR